LPLAPCPLPLTVIQAKFVLSAASASDFPRTGLPEIVLVGRSNVGKSSLINALVKQKVARTSAAPGKTRLANYYLIASAQRGQRAEAFGNSFYLVDLPGYGYARGGSESAETFGELTNQYFDAATRSSRLLTGVLHLIDARHPELEADRSAHHWLRRTGVPLAIVATKMDKLRRTEKLRAVSFLEASYDTSILPVSVLEDTGLDLIWKTIRSWV
jgi:GTP-binding protein